MSELTPRGQAIRDDLPTYYLDDRHVAAFLRASALELDRLEALLMAIIAGAFPATATDEHRFLGIWETQAGLPVEPENRSVAQRNNLLVTWLKNRKSGAASDWRQAITDIIGSDWDHWEYPDSRAPDPSTLAVDHPFDPTSGDPEVSYTGGQVEEFIAAVTPAHLEVHATYRAGFMVGYSRVGWEHL